MQFHNWNRSKNTEKRKKDRAKKNKDGEETKRKEKITFDDGKQMKKRKQRKIKFGKNKGKVLSKTVSWKDGKRSVKKEYIDKVDTSKLQKGGVRNVGDVHRGATTMFKKDKDGNKIEVFDVSKEGKKLSSIYKNVTEWRKFTEQKKVGGFKNSAVEKIMTGKGWIESHDISIDD